MAETPVFYDPVAGNVSLEFECTESWEKMPGSGRKRHCAACKRNVHELATYTSTEADELLERGACVRAEVEPDGQLVTLDSTRQRLVAAAAIAATLAVGGGCSEIAPPPGQEPEAGAKSSESFEEYRQRVEYGNAERPEAEFAQLPRGTRIGDKIDGIRWGYEPARTREQQRPKRPPLGKGSAKRQTRKLMGFPIFRELPSKDRRTRRR
jgi:hypothetical protein